MRNFLLASAALAVATTTQPALAASVRAKPATSATLPAGTVRLRDRAACAQVGEAPGVGNGTDHRDPVGAPSHSA